MPPSSLRELPDGQRWLTGQTPFFASTIDQRFSFGLHVPKCHSFDGPDLPVLVIIHGTRRQIGNYFTKLKDFSEQHRCVIFCPLFPAGTTDPEDIHNYKTILYKDIRFDLVLLSMLDQATKIWRLKVDRFFMHGFSGGGQFVQRFFYLHPNRLAAVSIGAPGRITPPDNTQPWPAGLSDVHGLFGISNVPDFQTMARVPVQMVVGANDRDTSMLEGIKNPNSAEQEAGETRVERLNWLRRAWKDKGVIADMTLVPGVAHNGMRCLHAVEEWMGPLIDSIRT
jgi:poly(3-hydroxybutyrate) depolymerase